MAVLGFSWAAFAWNLAFYVGATLVVRALTPRPPPIEGPRVDEAKLSTSTYGQSIVHGYGTTRVGGNVIWALPIREERQTETVGGKGGRGQRIHTYTYYGTLAVAVGEGPIDAVLRIWADSKLVYDRGGLPLGSSQTADREDIAEAYPEYQDILEADTPVTGTIKEGWRIRVYNGTEDQLPDPAMEADQGVGNTVPHRGLAYVVFDDCILTDFGNRIPLLSFEVAWKANPVLPIILPTYLPESQMVDQFNEISASFESGLYATWTSPDGAVMFSVFDIATNRQVGEFYIKDATTGTPYRDEGAGFDIQHVLYAFHLGLDGYIYASQFGETLADFVADRWYIWKIDPLTQSLIWTKARSGSTNLHRYFPTVMLEIGTDPTPYTIPSRFLITAPFYAGDFVIYAGATGDWVGTVDAVYQGYGGNGNARIARGYHDADICEAWLLDGPLTLGSPHPTADSRPFYLHRVRLSNGQQQFMYGGSPLMPEPDSDQWLTFTVYPQDLAPYIPGSPQFMPTRFETVRGVVFDGTQVLIPGSPIGERTKGEPMVFLTVTGSRTSDPNYDFLVKLDPYTGAILWAVNVPEYPVTSTHWGEARINNGVFAYTSSSADVPGPIDAASVTYIDTINGEIIQHELWLQSVVDYGVISWDASALYDSQRDAILTGGAGPEPYIVLLNRKSGDGVYLWEIVQNECLRAGYDADDLDVSQLTDLVLGYHVDQVMSARAAIEPLAIAYQFDGVESDWSLKFPKRGAASIVTITQDALAVLNDETGAVLIEQRTPDKELPQRVTVRYYEKDRDYESGAQYAARPSAPVRAMESDRHVAHDVPVVFRAVEVKQRCEWLLYEAWIGRTSLTVKLPWTFLRYDPLDVVNVNMNDGTVWEARIVQADLGADLSIEARLITEDAAIYSQQSVTQAEVGVGGGYAQNLLVPQSAPSQLLLIDAPLLLDTDDTGRTSSKLYVAASPGLTIGYWQGAVIYVSSDANSWVEGAIVSAAPTWGRATTVLEAPVSAWLTDRDNTLTVSLARGAATLESVTDLQLLNGANPALLINQLTGDVEVIQYRDVEQIGAQQFRLSHLLRGRRGTDTMMGGHSNADLFIVPTIASVATVTVPLSQLGSDRYYRAVTIGGMVDSGTGTALQANGRDLMPYAPCQQEIVVSGSDLVLSWVRRTRINGEWLDGGEDVPLAEDSERYEVDIYNAGGTAVVRTLSAGGTTAVTYTAAQMSSDFGGMPDSLTFCVYQLSAQVGRGFGEVITCDVPGRA